MVKDFGERGRESKGFGKGFWREEGEGRRRGRKEERIREVMKGIIYKERGEKGKKGRGREEGKG